jgi:hypothetical protein
MFPVHQFYFQILKCKHNYCYRQNTNFVLAEHRLPENWLFLGLVADAVEDAW